MLIEQLGLDLPPPYYAHDEEPETSNIGLTPSLWLAVLQHLVHPALPEHPRTLGWIHLQLSVRFVSRELYFLSMHLLRQHYLPQYLKQIRAPYTSDALSLTSASPSSASSGIPTLSHRLDRREVRVLDLYIAALTHTRQMHEESELILPAGLEDLFDLAQPRARLEDLVVGLGVQHAVLHSASPPPREERNADAKQPAPAYANVRTEVHASDLSCKFGLRAVSICLPFVSSSAASAARAGGVPRTIRKAVVDAPRSRDTPLEESARTLLQTLLKTTLVRNTRSGVVWYEAQ